MSSKRLLTLVCALSAVLLLWPLDAAAQRGGGGGGGGGGSHGGSGGGGGGRGGGGSGSGGHPNGGGGQNGGNHGNGGGGYHPSYGYGGSYYRPYYSYYRPYYSPYFYNGFYASFYYGLGWYPYYSSFAYGYGYPYGGAYAYGGYPYGYAYGYGNGWSSARLEIKPRDAQVYVDGYYVGLVDQFDGVMQRLDLSAGGHEVSIYMPGYHTYTERTYFQPGESYHYKAVLQPLAPGSAQDPKPQPSANAQNQQDPNQQQYAPAPYNGNPNGGNPSIEGPYRPAPPGGFPDPGRTQPLPERPTVDHRGENAGFGTLNLRVQPGDASVQIDGERWDSADGGSRLVVQLSAGTHKIEVRKDGFRPYSTTIQIRPGEPQTINVSLPQQD